MIDFEVLDARVDRTGDDDVATEECCRVAAPEDFETEASEGRVSAGEEASRAVSFFESALTARGYNAVAGGRREVVTLTARAARRIDAVTAEQERGVSSNRDHASASVAVGDKVTDFAEATKRRDPNSAVAVSG